MTDSYSVIHHTRGPVHLELRLPGSKSITNRVFILSALAHGETFVQNPLLSDDTVYMREALMKLGVSIETVGQEGFRIGGGKLPSGEEEFFVGNAGTAMRFLTSYLSLGKGSFVLTGNERMKERPIADLVSALNTLGASIGSAENNGCPPLKISAHGIEGGEAVIPGKNSSQYLSSILMAAPYFKKGCTLRVEGELASRPYLDMTLRMMRDFGITVQEEPSQVFHVPSGVYKSPEDYRIEPDASSASYFLGATAVLGGSVKLLGLTENSLQGDTAFAHVLEQMGCRVTYEKGGLRLESDGKLSGIDIDLNSMPDTVPTLAAVALFADGPTKIRNIGNLRIKECDRISALSHEIHKLGGKTKETIDSLEIFPEKGYNHAPIFTYNDHRIAMAFAVAGLKIEGLSLSGPGCVSKSFPGFFTLWESCFG